MAGVCKGGGRSPCSKVLCSKTLSSKEEKGRRMEVTKFASIVSRGDRSGPGLST